MFTGIIEEIGTIENIRPLQNGREFTIRAKRILSDLSVDHSVAVSGVCLTVTHLDSQYFKAEAVQETLQRSTLNGIKSMEEVNLERALRLNDRLGGHLVQGHVDGRGSVKRIQKQGTAQIVEVQIPKSIQNYTIEKGSITVDGISLTIAKLNVDTIVLSIIPHTWSNTTLRNLKVGSQVNIEADMIAKYVENFLTKKNTDSLSEEKLRSMGF